MLLSKFRQVLLEGALGLAEGGARRGRMRTSGHVLPQQQTHTLSALTNQIAGISALERVIGALSAN